MTSDLQCLRCRYQWKRRTWNRLPRQCPNCHRNDWNKPEVGPVGRPPLKPKTVKSNPEETMPTSAKDEFHARLEETMRVPRAITEDEMASLQKEANAAANKKFDDAVAAARGLQPDASTDDLLNHLLEQMEKEGT